MQPLSAQLKQMGCVRLSLIQMEDDNANEASSRDGTLALTTSPSTPHNSEESFCTASGSPPSIRSQDSMSTCDTNFDQGFVCRSCKFASSPFGALDQDGLCLFCSALSRHDGDTSLPSPNDLPVQGGCRARSPQLARA